MTSTSQLATYPSLQDKVTLITGGASGIGASLVEHFCRQQARVSYIDINEEAAATLNHQLTQAGLPTPTFYKVDLRDISSLEAAIQTIHQVDGPIRALINNAGWDERRAVGDVTPDFWDMSQEINLRPHFFAAQAVAEKMADAGGGSIVNLSSNSWMLGVPGMPAYVAAKAGIVGLTKALARELGPKKIRVNALLPGWVMTQRQIEKWLTPEAKTQLLAEQCLKETIQPEDVAQLALFLASDDSRMITAQSYVLDGGRT